MPNRILRDWTDSDKIDILDAAAERFFIRLIMKVDDYGRYTANCKMLKSTLFPLKTDIRETDIARWITACEKSDLIVLYNVASKEYVEIKNFKQQLRQKVEKYPSPASATHMHSISIADANMKRNEVETETNPKPKTASLDFIENKDFIPLVEKWLEYKKSRRETYKSEDSIKAFCKKLSELSGNDIITAGNIIEQSMANNWAGIFEVKNSFNVKSKINTGVTPNPARTGREYEPL